MREDSVLIDLGRRQGISAGDLFTVTTAGTKVIHPVTGKVLGVDDKIKAVVKAYRVKADFSYADILKLDEQPRTADPVHRFKGIQTLFWDYAGGSRALFENLLGELPTMAWETYETAQELRPPAGEKTRPDKTPRLYFIRTQDALVVRDEAFRVLHRYPLEPDGTRPAEQMREGPPVGRVPAKPETDRMPGTRAMIKDRGKVAKTVLPKAIISSDFIEAPEGIRIAATDGNKIDVYRLDNVPAPDVSYSLPFPADIFALNWWRPGKGKPFYVIVNYWRLDAPNAAVLQFKNDGLDVVEKHLPYIAGTFDLNGDRVPELLLGQQFNRETFWGEEIHSLSFEEGELRANPSPVALPDDFTVLGSALADVTGSGKPELLAVKNDRLRIYRGRTSIYRSPKGVGGSANIVSYAPVRSQQETARKFITMEVPPVVMNQPDKHYGQIIAVRAKRPFVRFPGLDPGIENSTVSVFAHQQKRWVTQPVIKELDFAVQGLFVSGSRLFVLGTDPGDLLDGGGQSYLIRYLLQ